MGLKQPAVLDIQRQIVDEKRTLDDTPVGQEVQRELFEQKRRHEGELRDLQAGLDKAIQQGKQELAETLAKLEEDKKEQMKAASEQEKALRADFDRLQRENEAKYAETINKLEEEKKAMQVEEEKRRKDLEGIGKQSESLNKTVDSLVAMRQKSEQEWQRQIGYLEKSALNEAQQRQLVLNQAAIQQRSLTSSLLQTLGGIVITGAGLYTGNPSVGAMGATVMAKAWGI